jgi:hypothetical protein
MAGLKTDARGNWSVTFRYGGGQFTKSAGSKDPRDAEAVRARVEDMVFRLGKGYLTVPEGADPGEFIVTGGMRTSKAVAAPVAREPGGLALW